MISRGRVLLGLVVCVAVGFLVVSFCQAQSISSRGSARVDASLKIEAFLVEVELDALSEGRGAGKLESIPLEKILSALRDADEARVISGASLSVLSGGDGQVIIENTGREHVVKEEDDDDEGDDERDRDDEDDEDEGCDDDDELMERNSFNGALVFHVNVSLTSENMIRVNYNFSHRVGHEEEAQEDDEEFENSSSANRQWIGGTILQAGKAAVIGSGSNDGTAVFLILRANIVK